jgi:DNA phosphorothioation system restriction enzyme
VPSGLRERFWKRVITTSSDDLIEDFFVPALKAAKRYDRGVGYFSSGWIQAASEGLLAFAANGGTARWVTSPILSLADWEALRSGYEARANEALHRALMRNIETLEASLRSETTSALSWMIADGVLSFKLAVPRERLDGEFHDKFGTFTDAAGDSIAFRGSYNESIQGLHNYESLSIYPSWEPVLQDFCESEAARFKSLWDNHDPNIRVYEIPEAAKAQILKLRTGNRPYETKAWSFPALDGVRKKVFSPPEGIELRHYQRDAANEWFKAGGKGIIVLATGGGKTLTALFIAHKLWQTRKRLIIVVACPFIVLADQWAKEMVRFGLDPIVCGGSQNSWKPKVEQALSAYSAGVRDVVAIATTNATFRNPILQQMIGRQADQVFFICDEVHNAGAEQFRQATNDSIPLRLGLSATPDRRFDDDGNTFLRSYFGPTVYEFGLREAIAAGVLTKYRYYPVLVSLDAAEAEEYLELTERISRLAAFSHNKSEDSDESQSYKRLLIKRARLIANASTKLPALRKLLSEREEPLKQALIYCGDGTVEKPDAGTMRQVSEACRILGEELGIRTRQYTAQEAPDDRALILEDFRQGYLDAVVAIRCLDEGVDIPSAKVGFLLASSSNPRQYVQRRGRLLRRAEGKDFSIIYDFIVVPPDMGGGESDAVFNLERKLFRRELARICEFCETAENGASALETLLPLRIKYNLLAGVTE